jgi:hypothetical protein
MHSFRWQAGECYSTPEPGSNRPPHFISPSNSQFILQYLIPCIEAAEICHAPSPVHSTRTQVTALTVDVRCLFA